MEHNKLKGNFRSYLYTHFHSYHISPYCRSFLSACPPHPLSSSSRLTLVSPSFPSVFYLFLFLYFHRLPSLLLSSFPYPFFLPFFLLVPLPFLFTFLHFPPSMSPSLSFTLPYLRLSVHLLQSRLSYFPFLHLHLSLHSYTPSNFCLLLAFTALFTELCSKIFKGRSSRMGIRL